MKLRLSHCSIRRSLKVVQRLPRCGSGVHSPCDPRHMNRRNLPGGLGRTPPAPPGHPGKLFLLRAPGMCWHLFRDVSGRAERQTRSPGYVPEQAPERPRLNGFSPKPENPHGACNLPGADRSCRSSIAVLVAGGQSAAVRDCVPTLATLRAPYRKRLIRDLPPSACLPFQARGKVPDRWLGASTCQPFRSPDKSRAALPLLPRARVIAPD